MPNNQTTVQEEYLNKYEAIQFVKDTFGLEIKESSLYQARCTNKLPKTKVLGKIVFTKSDIINLVKGGTK